MNENRPELTVDLEKLLAPISAEQPAGESLRYEGTYDRIREARREDDASLPQGIWQAPLKQADWEQVSAICLEALESRSKDLQIAAWLLEAWLHLHGFPGAREGIQLIRNLCEAFWEDLYPEIADDDIEARISPLEWVNEKLALPLKRIPITQPQGGHTSHTALHSIAHWESALNLENQAKRDTKVLRQAEAEGRVTLSRFRESVMLTPKPFYMALFEELSDVLDVVVELERFLEERCGSRGPSLHQFKDAIQQTQHLVNTVLQEREEEEVDVPEIGGDTGEMPMTPPPEEKPSVPGGPIRSRAEAYQRLMEIADYLAGVEPHSPTPYLVRRAVSWGSMTVMELLQELVQDERDLGAIYALLGVKEDG